MAWSFVGNAGNDGNNNSPSVTHGLSINSGDLVVAFVHSNDDNSNITAVQGTGGAWTAERDDVGVVDETNTYAIFSKEANSSEPATFTFGTTNSANWSVLVYVARPGAGESWELDVAGGQVVDSTNEPYVIDGITVSDDAIAFAFLGQDNRSSVSADFDFSVDNSYVGVLEQAGQQFAIGAYRIFSTGGATGDVTFTAADDAGESRAFGEHLAFKILSSGPFSADLGAAALAAAAGLDVSFSADFLASLSVVAAQAAAPQDLEILANFQAELGGVNAGAASAAPLDVLTQFLAELTSVTLAAALAQSVDVTDAAGFFADLGSAGLSPPSPLDVQVAADFLAELGTNVLAEASAQQVSVAAGFLVELTAGSLSALSAEELEIVSEFLAELAVAEQARNSPLTLGVDDGVTVEAVAAAVHRTFFTLMRRR